MSDGEPSSIKQLSRCAARVPALSNRCEDRAEVELDYAVYGSRFAADALFLFCASCELEMIDGGEDMHQALYRKWRPKTFDEVYGQDHITSILKYEIASSSFSHAYLFCGSRGTGKTTCAKILAKAVNCLDPQNGDPCGKCEACRSIDAGTATDVLEMDAASNNGVDNIRDIRDEVVYSPSNLKCRVYIVDEVHMLSASAFNALLKTLEEPPEHVVFILATTELHKLPATIISRCQRFDFRRISTDILRDHIMRIAQNENIEIERSAATTIAKCAQGGMRDAISLLDLCSGSRRVIDDELVAQTIGSSGRGEMLDIVKAIAQKDYDKIFGAIDAVVQSSRDITVFWQDLISVYRDVLVVKSVQDPSRYLDLTDSESEQLAAVAKLFSAERLSYHCSMLTEALTTMLKANAVRRIVAELTLVRMCDERVACSNEAMQLRISALESAVAARSLSARDTDTEAENNFNTRQRRKTVHKQNDDDEFRADAPPSAQSAASDTGEGRDNGKRVLRPFRGRAELIESVVRKDPMLASFFKMAKWYSDVQGKLIIKCDTQFAIDKIKENGGERLILNELSALPGKEYAVSGVSIELDASDSKADVIDQIIEAAEKF